VNTLSDHFDQGLKTIISTLGSACDYHRRGVSVAEKVQIAISAIPKEQTELIAAIGIDGSMGYLRPITPAPVKYDGIETPGGGKWAVHTVGEIIVSGKLIGYRLGLKR